MAGRRGGGGSLSHLAGLVKRALPALRLAEEDEALPQRAGNLQAMSGDRARGVKEGREAVSKGWSRPHTM